jgi:hypothetical protein
MDESAAWVAQAAADRAAAEREHAFAKDLESPSWCHAVAKYQQAVEKYIKSIVAGLRECGVRGVPATGYDHLVQNHLRLLRRLPGGGAGRSVQSKLKEFLDVQTRNGIRNLENLAPKRPGPGELHSRNTEYPFNAGDGDWTYPADPDSFSVAEVREFHKLMAHVSYYARNIVSALRRGPG